MPISDDKYYTFKYVNGHPENSRKGLFTVVATGQLSSAETGYPLLYTEMTLLTAIRTAATSALASKWLAPKNAHRFGIIGTGAQSEFQTLAHLFSQPIYDIYYFDIDPKAMEKFAKNMKPYGARLHPCTSGRQVVDNSDILTTATAQKGHHRVIEASWIKRGIHINKIGGDSPGKTEMDPHILEKAKVVVELLEQTKHEGEMQQLKDFTPFAELWQIIQKQKIARETAEDITLFDSVGFALEDFSILTLILELAGSYDIGSKLPMTPYVQDTKNLFGFL
jgi:ornithine cyclodeaminase